MRPPVITIQWHGSKVYESRAYITAFISSKYKPKVLINKYLILRYGLFLSTRTVIHMYTQRDTIPER